MSSTPIIPPSNLPPAFAYDPTNPTYHIEWLSWLQMRNLQAMAAAGMVWTDHQPTAAEQSALQAVWSAQTGAIALQSDELTTLKPALSQQEAAWVDTLLAENSALYGLPCTGENLRIRRALLDQHLQTLHYLRGVRLTPITTPIPITLPATDPEDVNADLWSAQTSVIALQSDELTALKTTLSQQEAAWVDTLLAENTALYLLTATPANYRTRQRNINQHLAVLHYLRGLRFKPGADPLAIAIPQAANEALAISFDRSASHPLWIQTVQPAQEEFPEALWDAQDDLIAEQSDYCNMIAELLERKRKSLPDDDAWYEKLITELLQYGAEQGVGYLVFKYTQNRKLAEFVGVLASVSVGWAIAKLKHIYDQATQNSRKIAAENAELLKLPQSRENYILRRETLELHEMQMANMLAHVAAIEAQAKPGNTTGSGDDLKADELVEALKDLQYNDEVIYLDKHTRRVNLRGKIREELTK